MAAAALPGSPAEAEYWMAPIMIEVVTARPTTADNNCTIGVTYLLMIQAVALPAGVPFGQQTAGPSPPGVFERSDVIGTCELEQAEAAYTGEPTLVKSNVSPKVRTVASNSRLSLCFSEFICGYYIVVSLI